MRRSRPTQLLVDADGVGIAVIEEAIKKLQDEGNEVRVTIFAEPRRPNNKKWRRLLQEPYIQFKAVARAKDHVKEANDHAIATEMLNLSNVTKQGGMALLTPDAGFAKTILQLGIRERVVVLVSGYNREAIERYERESIRVLRLHTSKSAQNPKVRALLRNDGTGSVQLAGPYESGEHGESIEAVQKFLQNLGYDVERGKRTRTFMIQATAKFWFMNQLGSLTVFPSQLATVAMEQVVQSSTRKSRERYSGNLAYVLPIAGAENKSKRTIKRYGSGLAKRIFHGGGPLMLYDSPSMVEEALRKLGYLDDALNSSLQEALLCFVNANYNKLHLRLIDRLPKSGDTLSDVSKRIRAALLSHGTRGYWQSWSSNSVERISRILKQAGILDIGGEQSLQDLFEAMRVYARVEQLPPMRTFNGLAWRISRHHLKCDTRRETIEFE